jgi:hypothetical protein
MVVARARTAARLIRTVGWCRGEAHKDGDRETLRRRTASASYRVAFTRPGSTPMRYAPLAPHALR